MAVAAGVALAVAVGVALAVAVGVGVAIEAAPPLAVPGVPVSSLFFRVSRCLHGYHCNQKYECKAAGNAFHPCFLLHVCSLP